MCNLICYDDANDDDVSVFEYVCSIINTHSVIVQTHQSTKGITHKPSGHSCEQYDPSMCGIQLSTKQSPLLN